MKIKGIYIPQEGEMFESKPNNFTGVFKHWYNNKQLWVEIFYKERCKHGTYKKWNMNGELFFKEVYKNGKEIH